MKRRLSPVFSVALILMLVIGFLPQPQPALALSTDVVISQVYGGGGNSGATYKNDFIELFNRGSSSVSLGGWSVQYTSSAGTSWQVTNLTNVSLAPGQYYLVQEAAGTGGTMPLPAPDTTGSIPMSATAGKVALVHSTAALSGGCPTAVDFVGFGTANCFEGAATLALTNTTAALRGNNGCTETDNNIADFVVGAPTPRNTASPIHDCTEPTPPSGGGAATPSTLVENADVLLTVAVTPGTHPDSTGLTVTCDVSTIGGSATQSLFDNETNGDVTANDNTFSFLTTVAPGTSTGTATLPCNITDAQSRTGSASISVTVTAIRPIGEVNGPVFDTDNATAHRSSFASATGNGAGTTAVVVQGVIYELTQQAISNSTNHYNGFFIQNTSATADTDSNTSDGLFVFMNTPTSIPSANGPYTPHVGDEVVISGNISEFFNMTEMQSPNLGILKVVRSAADIDTEVPPVDANPPANIQDANRYWERLQGMRVSAPANSVVLGGRNVFSPADAEIWLARPDSTVAQRTDPYARRAFRDAHPLDDNYDPANWDGNGYRLLLGSLGVKSAAGDAQALIDPARTFDTLTTSAAGGINYSFSKYRIEVSAQPTFAEGPDPSQNNAPQAFDRTTGYSIVDYNLENLYDYRNNPFSGCDFTGDSGCAKVDPFTAAVTPPYDYVPASDAAYQARLTAIATEIINDLHSPDILMLQEIENQDICTVSGAALVCGTTDNADGKPDVLQELALHIAQQGGPAYDAAFDRNSSDLRGIAPSFMYRTDRVTLAPAAGDPVLGGTPAIGSYVSVPYDGDISNPKTLNAVLPAGITACETNWVFPRAPDIAKFRVYNQTVGVGGYRDVYVIDNHFKSGPDTCVDHRTEQAKYNAALVKFIQAANPEARVVVGGDLNVYPRPDDPFAPIGQPGSSDQLGSLYDSSLGLKSLWEVLRDQAPQAAYSYVFVGMAQTLDQMFVNPLMLGGLQQYRIAHINSDFPADYPGDVARGTSDHDPNVAQFQIFNFSGFLQPVDNLPELNVAKAGSSIPVKFSLGGDQELAIFAAGYPKSTQIACSSSAPTDAIEQTVTAGSSSLQYDPVSQTYTYVWKTDKTWANTCRQLSVELTDGATYRANFEFKK